MTSSYSLTPAMSNTALDAFSSEGRLARRGQREVTRAVMQHMVAGVIRDSRSETLARMSVEGAMRSMDVARRIHAYANDEPMCLEIGGAYVATHVRADVADLEAVARALA